MNKLVYSLSTALLLVGSSAFAQGASNTAIDTQSKHALRDSQMDNVTAGSAIAIDDANVTSNDSGVVSLSGGALSGASGVNIVTSSNSLVANGVNVYDSSLANQDTGKASTVNQVNVAKQTEATNSTSSLDATVVPLGLTADVNVAATNVASDSASIDVTTKYSVDLAGTAEQNAQALNIVNAAGGMVANGVNIAHSSNVNATPTLNQFNISSQAR
jgi:hypothetical protein